MERVFRAAVWIFLASVLLSDRARLHPRYLNAISWGCSVESNERVCLV